MANDELEALVTDRTAELRRANERLQAELAERKRTEEALKLAVRASNTGLWDWDILTGDIYFSPEWKAQIGYEEHELPNRIGEWERRLHPDDRERVLSTVNAYLANPWSDYEVEFRLGHRDGSYRWILARAKLFTDDEGKPRRMLGSHLDITERKRSERALRESENQFRTLAETASDAIITLDEAGRIAFINQAAETVFGYSRHETLNANLTMLMPECLKRFQRAGFPRHRGTGEQHTSREPIELQGLHKNGSEIPLELSLGEFTQDDKRFFTCIARDITERKRAEEGLHLLQTITLSISQSEDLDSALAIVLRTVCEATGWILGQVWTPNREGTVLECSSAWHDIWLLPIRASGVDDLGPYPPGFCGDGHPAETCPA